MSAVHGRTELVRTGAYGVLAAVGAVVSVTALRYGIFTDEGLIGPGFLPMVAGALLASFGAVLLLNCYRGRDVAESAKPAELAEPFDSAEAGGDDRDRFGRALPQRVRMLWSVFGLAFAALTAVGLFGFLVAMGALMFVVSTAVERRPIVVSALITATSMLALYLIFGLFLRVPLPGGLLGLGTEG